MYSKIFGIPVYIWRRLCLVNLGVVVVLAAINFGLLNAHAQNTSISTAQNCDSNAVIWCGASSVNQLINRFNNGDGHNSAASIDNIFNFFGISTADINAMNDGTMNVEAGNVTRGGDVFDSHGHLVATNAMTGGRQDIAGSTRVVSGGTVFFTRPPSVSFRSSPLAAFVVMRNGRFAFAILASCGNAVKATPVVPPPAPKPAPTPKPTPAAPTPTPAKPVTICSGNTTSTNSGAGSQAGNCNTTVVQTQTTTVTPTQPTFTCDALTITQADNRLVTISNLQVTAANGATFTGVDIDWGDGSNLSGTANVIGQTHQFAQDGATASTFTISAVAHFNVNGQDMTAGGVNCQRQVTFTAPSPPPAAPAASVTPPAAPAATPAPAAAPAQLVNTGPGGNMLGIFGVTTVLGTLGYRFFLNRRLSL